MYEKWGSIKPIPRCDFLEYSSSSSWSFSLIRLIFLSQMSSASSISRLSYTAVVSLPSLCHALFSLSFSANEGETVRRLPLDLSLSVKWVGLRMKNSGD
ncbi:hypothetical protein Syun_029491 [Stephania yunnanensis]|uniref:Uncharacterized protein n=1 Tax=Stephania yunnanensis TaxID=152371 RepID=A0AAP0E922_9MAGN